MSAMSLTSFQFTNHQSLSADSYDPNVLDSVLVTPFREVLELTNKYLARGFISFSLIQGQLSASRDSMGKHKVNNRNQNAGLEEEM